MGLRIEFGGEVNTWQIDPVNYSFGTAKSYTKGGLRWKITENLPPWMFFHFA
jgi:hypothetical protein